MSLSEYVIISPVTDKVMINLNRLHKCEGFDLNRLQSFVNLVDDGKSYRSIDGELFVTCKVFAEICRRNHDPRLSEVRDRILAWFDIANFREIDVTVSVNKHVWDILAWLYRIHGKYLKYLNLDTRSVEYVDHFEDINGRELKDLYHDVHRIAQFETDYILRKDTIK